MYERHQRSGDGDRRSSLMGTYKKHSSPDAKANYDFYRHKSSTFAGSFDRRQSGKFSSTRDAYRNPRQPDVDDLIKKHSNPENLSSRITPLGFREVSRTRDPTQYFNTGDTSSRPHKYELYATEETFERHQSPGFTSDREFHSRVKHPVSNVDERGVTLSPTYGRRFETKVPEKLHDCSFDIHRYRNDLSPVHHSFQSDMEERWYNRMDGFPDTGIRRSDLFGPAETRHQPNQHAGYTHTEIKACSQSSPLCPGGTRNDHQFADFGGNSLFSQHWDRDAASMPSYSNNERTAQECFNDAQVMPLRKAVDGMKRNQNSQEKKEEDDSRKSVEEEDQNKMECSQTWHALRILFVHGLSKSATKQSFKHHFSRFGKITRFNLKRKKGRGHVIYAEPESVERALERDVHWVGTDNVKVSRERWPHAESLMLGESMPYGFLQDDEDNVATQLPTDRALKKQKKRQEQLKSATFRCLFCETITRNRRGHVRHKKNHMHKSKVRTTQERLLKDMSQQYTKALLKVEACRQAGETVKFCTTCFLQYTGGAEEHAQSQVHAMVVKESRSFCEKCDSHYDNNIKYMKHQMTFRHMRNTAYQLASEGVREPEPCGNFSGAIPIGVNAVVDTRGFYCTACKLFFSRKLSSINDHCATARHLSNLHDYIKAMTDLSRAKDHDENWNKTGESRYGDATKMSRNSCQ